MKTKQLILSFGLIFTLCGVCFSQQNKPDESLDWDRFYKAIHQIESSGKLNPPAGDGGRAIGPYQIWDVYWQDAVEYDSSLVKNGETYQECRDKAYAERVIRAYMDRYVTKKRLKRSPLPEDYAATHNGGPNGFKKKSTNERIKEYITKFNKEYNNG